MDKRVFGTLLTMTVCAVLSLFLTRNAFAIGDVPQQTSTVYHWSSGTASGNASSMSAACAAAGNAWATANSGASSGYTYTGETYSGYTCTDTFNYWYVANGSVQSGGSNTRNFTISVSSGSACPGNSTGPAADGSACECVKGYKPASDGSCVPYDCSSVTGSYTVQYGNFATASAALGSHAMCSVDPTDAFYGCAVQFTTESAGQSADGKWWASSSHATVYSSGQCGGAGDTNSPGNETAGNTKAPQPCGSGQVPGTVNGQSVCVPSQQTAAPPTQSAASAPDGSSTQTTSQTTCVNGTCTTTTTTVNTPGPGGTCASGPCGTSSSQSQEPQTQYCQQNPNDPQCKTTDSFGGSCAGSIGAFTCSGDAVQCAIAQEQHERDCQFYGQPDQATQDKYSALTSADPASGATSLDVSSMLPQAPSSACAVQDTQVSFGSGVTAFTVTLPLGTDLCPHLMTIRSVVVAFGGLFFVMIVFVK